MFHFEVPHIFNKLNVAGHGDLVLKRKTSLQDHNSIDLVLQSLCQGSAIFTSVGLTVNIYFLYMKVKQCMSTITLRTSVFLSVGCLKGGCFGSLGTN